MSELARGEQLDDRFTLLRPLGSGGMGDVWLVHDRLLEQDLVAKLPPADASEEAIELLKRECRHVRSLNHPNIVPVYELHEGRERPFVTMAHLEGRPLSDYRLREPAEILGIARGIAAALGFAHRKGVVHRDLKASNVLIDAEGEPHLLDFGVSALLGEGESAEPRGGGSRFHRSPQQLAGESPRPTDDIYAFGVLLYDLLSGQPPFWPDADEARIRFETPPPVSSPHPLPAALVTLVARMLEKDPGKRPVQVAEVERELERIAAGLERATRMEEPASEQGPKFRPKPEVKLTPPPRVPAVQVGVPSFSPSISPGAGRAGGSFGRRGASWGTLGLFLMLGLVAVGVFVVLPDLVVQTPPPSDGVSDALPAEAESETVGADPIDDLKRQALVKDRAERAREPVQRELEAFRARRAGSWGGEAFRAVEAGLKEGEAQLARRDYATAEMTFERAAESLSELRGRARAVVRESIEAGQRALAGGRSREATEAFQLARTIEPDNTSAGQGLSRAGKLDALLGLLAEGASREGRGDLDGAIASYREAVGLDPLSQSAQRALARVDAQATEAAFTSAMTEGMAALENGAFDEARAAFERAAAIRPESDEPKDAVARAEEGLRLAAIAGHRSRAEAHEESEAWRDALSEYEKVLAIDATIRFAQRGKERASARARLDETLQFHLSHPERFTDERALNEARALLTEAREDFLGAAGASPVGPRLRGQLDALAKAIDEASVPMRVVLQSDNLTKVMIYRVGQLGSFEEQALELRPGTYTVVGSRSGYRDVRVELVVVAGEAPKPLLVRCEEKL